MAVEQLANEGRLDLEPARIQAAEEWSDDEADEGEEALEEDDVSDSNEEVIDTTNSAEAHCEEKGESCGQSSQVQNSLKVTEESEPKKFTSEAESDQTTVAHTESVKCEAELVTLGDNMTESSSVIQAPPSVSLTTSDIQDVRQNLLSASQEAQQLLRDLQNIDSSE